jgi:hypothetical protein
LGYEPFPYVGGISPRNEIEPNVSEGAHDDSVITVEPHNEIGYSPRFPKVHVFKFTHALLFESFTNAGHTHK